MQLLLAEVTDGAALGTHLEGNSKQAHTAHLVFVSTIVLVVLGGLAVGIYIAVKSVVHIHGSGNNNSNNHSSPTPPPNTGPSSNGGIPLTGPGSGTGCYPSSPTSGYMPDGCTQEPNPRGRRWEWGKLDISVSQPPYQEQEGCGGSCGDAAGNIGMTNASSGASMVLVCPPGKVVGVSPETAPFRLSNPYPHPAMVRSLASQAAGGTQGRRSFNGVRPTNAKDGDWPCYWNTDFDPTTGMLLTGATPALVPPGATVPLSYAFKGGQETLETQGEAAALAFIVPQCTNHGPAWKQISGAYPPCQDTSPLAEFVEAVSGIGELVGMGESTQWPPQSPKGQAWGQIVTNTNTLHTAMQNVGHQPWQHVASTTGVLTDLKSNMRSLQQQLAAEQAEQATDDDDDAAATPRPRGTQLSFLDNVVHGLDAALGKLAALTCICGDPLLPSNPGCPHFWDLHSTIAPSTGSYFAFRTGVINADPIPQVATRTAVKFPTNSSVLTQADVTTADLEKVTAAQYVQQHATEQYVVQPLLPPMGPQSPFSPAAWSTDGADGTVGTVSTYVPQLPMCSEAGLTK